jgi:HAD superfamily hydrolase (TIGR01509 family)
MATLSALIFDVDGTLAETEELHRLAFNAAFAAAGLPWDWDTDLYARLLEVTGGKERIAHYVGLAGGPRLARDTIATLHAEKTARYTELVAQGGLALRPGVARLLAEARAGGVRLAIATTTSRPNVDALLRATLGADPFDVIAAGDEVAAKKPAPDIYRLALERLGLPPTRCIAIEDTSNGLLSAQGAGLPCVMTTSLYGGHGPFPGALAVVTQLGDPGDPARSQAGPAPAGEAVHLSDLRRWLDEPGGG